MTKQEKIAQLEQDLTTLKAEIASEKLIQNEIASGSPMGLAEILHKYTCHANHTDGCSWFYEDWTSNPGYAKSRYLTLAKGLLQCGVHNGVFPKQISALMQFLASHI